MRPDRLLALLAIAVMVLAPTFPARSETAPVPLIKLEYPGNPPNVRMLYIRIQKLGERMVDSPLLFDTGSAGITIDCAVVLPANLCSTTGIKIDAPLELDGLTVTTKQRVSQYGTYDEYGNIAIARVSFGAPDSPVVTTKAIPILIRYKKVRRSNGEIVGGPLWPHGIFGVAPVAGQIGGELVSPMDFVDPGPGRHAGFSLSPIGRNWIACTNEEGTCPEVAALHIGVDPAEIGQFSTFDLDTTGSQHYQPYVDTCLAWGDKKVCAPTLFDTGNSTIMIAGPPRQGGDMSLPVGVGMRLSWPSGLEWRYAIEYRPEAEFAPLSDVHLIGIRYFEANSLLIDLKNRKVGFRLGQ